MERIIGGKIRIMRTINRNPITTWVLFEQVHIEWKCHGIDQDGNRQHWHEYTQTFLPGHVPLTQRWAC